MPTALVTGTSSGFGAGVATRLVDLGWDVVGTVLEQPSDPPPWHVVVADVTDDDAMAGLGELVERRWGRLDALVNNAGTAVVGAFEEMTPAELRHAIDVNVVGPMVLTRACLPALRTAGGVVVMVSSVSGTSGDALMGAYNASKFGLEGASEALMLEVAGQGVRVVVVEPGPFRTGISASSRIAEARDGDGRYAARWAELDAWLAWLESSSADPARCVEAIVGAITRPDAPFRIPVGEGIPAAVRRSAERRIEQANAAEEFLRSLNP
jgi:NAD(P)-dependent dehydrogenase (short-subunit alcohol dehydrogenase family)